MSALRFDITHRAADCLARVGRVTTPHGCFDTPAFMPVGTQGTVKGLLPAMVRALGSQIILGNTYHLMLRPGAELIARMGGLHRWMGWPGPILTDSGGYQVFSLGHINRIDDDGVVFKSHLDGSEVNLTPQRSIAVQHDLGSDIIMALDDCPPSGEGSEVRGQESGIRGQESGGRSQGAERGAEARAPSADPSRVRQAAERSVRWLERCVEAHDRADRQALFGIVQGGTDLDLRSWCAQAVAQHDLPGYAIGGVAVGESFASMRAVVEHTARLLPAVKPRYLMGVGYERDLLMAVRAGVDMFDCVLPTRNGRNANAFTPTGQIRLRNAKYADDPRPIDETCDCPACGGGVGVGSRKSEVESPESVVESQPTTVGARSPGVPGLSTFDFPTCDSPTPCFSRSYLRHLFMAGEMLGPILVSAHNLRYFQRYLLDIRLAITDNNWPLVHRNWPVAGL